jgi:hypothetical protein
MASDSSAPPDRDLQRGLASARDGQIANVVAVVDAMAARGSADDMIAPLRPRLAQIRPRRPLRFSRLLFMPLDPLIVPAHAWKPDSVTIPRTALPVMADIVRAAMGEEAHVVEAMIHHHAMDDAVIAVSAGRILWPAAASIFAEAIEPPDWPRTGLRPNTCVPLLRQMSTLLAHAELLEDLYAEAEIGVALQPEQLRPLIGTAAKQGADTLAMTVTVLLARLPETLGMLGRTASMIGPSGSDQLQLAAERAIEVLLDRLEAKSGIETLIVANSLGQVGAEVRHVAHLLDALPNDGTRPQWRPRQQAIAARLEAICQLRLATALDVEFVEALGTIAEDSSAEAIMRLEDAARGLRDLEHEARQIGCPEACDTLLQRAASLVNEAGSEQTLDLVDRVRLVEILAGPETALAMLDAAEGVATDATP